MIDDEIRMLKEENELLRQEAIFLGTQQNELAETRGHLEIAVELLEQFLNEAEVLRQPRPETRRFLKLVTRDVRDRKMAK